MDSTSCNQLSPSSFKMDSTSCNQVSPSSFKMDSTSCNQVSPSSFKMDSTSYNQLSPSSFKMDSTSCNQVSPSSFKMDSTSYNQVSPSSFKMDSTSCNQLSPSSFQMDSTSYNQVSPSSFKMDSSGEPDSTILRNLYCGDDEKLSCQYQCLNTCCHYRKLQTVSNQTMHECAEIHEQLSWMNPHQKNMFRPTEARRGMMQLCKVMALSTLNCYQLEPPLEPIIGNRMTLHDRRRDRSMSTHYDGQECLFKHEVSCPFQNQCFPGFHATVNTLSSTFSDNDNCNLLGCLERANSVDGADGDGKSLWEHDFEAYVESGLGLCSSKKNNQSDDRIMDRFVHVKQGNVVAVTKLVSHTDQVRITATAHIPVRARRRSKKYKPKLERLDLPWLYFRPGEGCVNEENEYNSKTGRGDGDGKVVSEKQEDEEERSKEREAHQERSDIGNLKSIMDGATFTLNSGDGGFSYHDENATQLNVFSDGISPSENTFKGRVTQSSINVQTDRPDPNEQYGDTPQDRRMIHREIPEECSLPEFQQNKSDIVHNAQHRTVDIKEASTTSSDKGNSHKNDDGGSEDDNDVYTDNDNDRNVDADANCIDKSDSQQKLATNIPRLRLGCPVIVIPNEQDETGFESARTYTSYLGSTTSACSERQETDTGSTCSCGMYIIGHDGGGVWFDSFVEIHDLQHHGNKSDNCDDVNFGNISDKNYKVENLPASYTPTAQNFSKSEFYSELEGMSDIKAMSKYAHGCNDGVLRARPWKRQHIVIDSKSMGNPTQELNPANDDNHNIIQSTNDCDRGDNIKAESKEISYHHDQMTKKVEIEACCLVGSDPLECDSKFCGTYKDRSVLIANHSLEKEEELKDKTNTNTQLITLSKCLDVIDNNTAKNLRQKETTCSFRCNEQPTTAVSKENKLQITNKKESALKDEVPRLSSNMDKASNSSNENIISRLNHESIGSLSNNVNIPNSNNGKCVSTPKDKRIGSPTDKKDRTFNSCSKNQPSVAEPNVLHTALGIQMKNLLTSNGGGEKEQQQCSDDYPWVTWNLRKGIPGQASKTTSRTNLDASKRARPVSASIKRCIQKQNSPRKAINSNVIDPTTTVTASNAKSTDLILQCGPDEELSKSAILNRNSFIAEDDKNSCIENNNKDIVGVTDVDESHCEDDDMGNKSSNVTNSSSESVKTNNDKLENKSENVKDDDRHENKSGETVQNKCTTMVHKTANNSTTSAMDTNRISRDVIKNPTSNSITYKPSTNNANTNLTINSSSSSSTTKDKSSASNIIATKRKNNNINNPKRPDTSRPRLNVRGKGIPQRANKTGPSLPDCDSLPVGNFHEEAQQYKVKVEQMIEYEKQLVSQLDKMQMSDKACPVPIMDGFTYGSDATLVGVDNDTASLVENQTSYIASDTASSKQVTKDKSGDIYFSDTTTKPIDVKPSWSKSVNNPTAKMISSRIEDKQIITQSDTNNDFNVAMSINNEATTAETDSVNNLTSSIIGDTANNTTGDQHPTISTLHPPTQIIGNNNKKNEDNENNKCIWTNRFEWRWVQEAKLSDAVRGGCSMAQCVELPKEHQTRPLSAASSTNKSNDASSSKNVRQRYTSVPNRLFHIPIHKRANIDDNWAKAEERRRLRNPNKYKYKAYYVDSNYATLGTKSHADGVNMDEVQEENSTPSGPSPANGSAQLENASIPDQLALPSQTSATIITEATVGVENGVSDIPENPSCDNTTPDSRCPFKLPPRPPINLKHLNLTIAPEYNKYHERYSRRNNLGGVHTMSTDCADATVRSQRNKCTTPGRDPHYSYMMYQLDTAEVESEIIDKSKQGTILRDHKPHHHNSEGLRTRYPQSQVKSNCAAKTGDSSQSNGVTTRKITTVPLKVKCFNGPSPKVLTRGGNETAEEDDENTHILNNDLEKWQTELDGDFGKMQGPPSPVCSSLIRMTRDGNELAVSTAKSALLQFPNRSVYSDEENVKLSTSESGHNVMTASDTHNSSLASRYKFICRKDSIISSSSISISSSSSNSSSSGGCGGGGDCDIKRSAFLPTAPSQKLNKFKYDDRHHYNKTVSHRSGVKSVAAATISDVNWKQPSNTNAFSFPSTSFTDSNTSTLHNNSEHSLSIVSSASSTSSISLTSVSEQEEDNAPRRLSKQDTVLSTPDPPMKTAGRDNTQILSCPSTLSSSSCTLTEKSPVVMDITPRNPPLLHENKELGKLPSDDKRDDNHSSTQYQHDYHRHQFLPHRVKYSPNYPIRKCANIDCRSSCTSVSCEEEWEKLCTKTSSSGSNSASFPNDENETLRTNTDNDDTNNESAILVDSDDNDNENRDHVIDGDCDGKDDGKYTNNRDYCEYTARVEILDESVDLCNDDSSQQKLDVQRQESKGCLKPLHRRRLRWSQNQRSEQQLQQQQQQSENEEEQQQQYDRTQHMPHLQHHTPNMDLVRNSKFTNGDYLLPDLKPRTFFPNTVRSSQNAPKESFKSNAIIENYLKSINQARIVGDIDLNTEFSTFNVLVSGKAIQCSDYGYYDDSCNTESTYPSKYVASQLGLPRHPGLAGQHNLFDYHSVQTGYGLPKHSHLNPHSDLASYTSLHKQPGIHTSQTTDLPLEYQRYSDYYPSFQSSIERLRQSVDESLFGVATNKYNVFNNLEYADQRRRRYSNSAARYYRKPKHQTIFQSTINEEKYRYIDKRKDNGGKFLTLKGRCFPTKSSHDRQKTDTNTNIIGLASPDDAETSEANWNRRTRYSICRSCRELERTVEV